MATYNLSASDLITLLDSTLTPQTATSVLDNLASSLGTSILADLTNVYPVGGPSDTSSSGTGTTAVTPPPGTKILIVTTPQSTSTVGAGFDTPTAGSQSTRTTFFVTSPGGVDMVAGDQAVTLADFNSSGVADTLLGGAGRERLSSNGVTPNVLVGGSGLNTLVGGSGADTLLGGAQSRLVAGSGANILMSSTLSGGSDTLVGGAGADLLVAQGGNNRLIAGTGLNTLQGGSGNDTLIGGGHTDIILGSGNSRVVESVSGSSDTINAGTGADTVQFTYGKTNIADSIIGSSTTGSLRVIDLAGSNNIISGATSDTVVLSSSIYSGNGSTQTNTSNQTITASSGGSVRVVTNEAFSNYSDVTAPGGVNTVTFSDTGQTLKINDATGNSVTLVFGTAGTDPTVHAPINI